VAHPNPGPLPPSDKPTATLQRTPFAAGFAIIAPMNKFPEVLLGFDFGMKRIGTAIGQTVTQTARPLGVIKARLGVPQWESIAALVKTWHPDAFVVGIPLNMDGTEQPLTQQARQFADALQERFQLPVYGMFASGGYKLLQTTSVDSVAAQLILQNWLEQTKPNAL
jgi:putative Holliday junction resolvase